jgi:hypothetical protein
LLVAPGMTVLLTLVLRPLMRLLLARAATESTTITIHR